MFQQILLRPQEVEVVTTPNLNGGCLSDASAAWAGGVGMAPGANVGDGVAVFGATHGTARKYAGEDNVNPDSLALSAHMMLTHMGWDEAAQMVDRGLAGAVQVKTVPHDLERQMEGADLLETSELGRAIVAGM